VRQVAANYRCELLQKHHDRSSFSCGNAELDRYIHAQAGQDQKRGVAAPYVLVEIATGTLVGYYTLSATSISLVDLPAPLAKRLPRYPTVPATLLGRLARDARYRGRGVGELLLSNAVRHSYRIAREIASIGVIVDAIDDTARAFYEQYGFARLPEQDYRLVLPMSAIRELFVIAEQDG